MNVFPDNPPILVIIQKDKHDFGTMVAEILFCDPWGDVSKFLTANADILQKMVYPVQDELKINKYFLPCHKRDNNNSETVCPIYLKTWYLDLLYIDYY